MTEQNVAPLEPTPFGAAVMDLCLERGVGNPQNLRPLRDDQHKALEGHMNGVSGGGEPWDLCLDVALAFGIDPNDLVTERDKRDSMKLSMAYTFGELAKATP
jgi:hypothetical protein